MVSRYDIIHLATEMSMNYVEMELIQYLKESDNDIIKDLGKQVLNDEGYPDWTQLKDVDYAIDLTSKYTAEEWAELALELFNIENIKDFLSRGMYIMFEEFIEYFDIDIKILTDKESVVAEY